MTAVAPRADIDGELRDELARRGSSLRAAEHVTGPSALGAARPHRYSFSRTLLRRAARDRWKVDKARTDLDELGRGEIEWRWLIDGSVFTFVAFTQLLDEALHTDRVVADDWEISAVLVEGDVDDQLLRSLRENVPRQEHGRFDPRVLVLTRGNRSVRFFDLLVDTLAAGQQPDGEQVGDAGYIMRSTAFYGNGKFGMRSFEGYPGGHPFAVPYRAQFATAFLFRELSYDIVEHCARAKGGDRAVAFDAGWRTWFGLGNATGLGLVPYAFKHPRVIHAWAAVRELALADVRQLRHGGDHDARVAKVTTAIDRARTHFMTGTTADCTPFASPAELVPRIDAIARTWGRVQSDELPFDALYRWADELDDPETTGLVVSILVELHEGDDDAVDRLLSVDEHRVDVDTAPQTVGDALELIAARFDFLDQMTLEAEGADHYWWVTSDRNEEPRRTRRHRLAPQGRDVAIDIALRMRRFRDALIQVGADGNVDDFVDAAPEHRLALKRLRVSDRCYGEIRDNACADDYLPLQVQRFQLAMYGMDNYKPKSTDWLRVTLFQGAPRVDELNDDPDTMPDDWFFPARPTRTTSSNGAST